MVRHISYLAHCGYRLSVTPNRIFTLVHNTMIHKYQVFHIFWSYSLRLQCRQCSPTFSDHAQTYHGASSSSGVQSASSFPARSRSSLPTSPGKSQQSSNAHGTQDSNRTLGEAAANEASNSFSAKPFQLKKLDENTRPSDASSSSKARRKSSKRRSPKKRSATSVKTIDDFYVDRYIHQGVAYDLQHYVMHPEP